jgi:diguanylate cyclase (GGDEF)-like protein
VADRIMQKVRMLAIPADDEGVIRCSISLGIADYRSADATSSDVIRRADERLYDAKRGGKNRYSA